MRSILAVILKHQKNMEAEKIICCDGGRSNDALAYAAMANANRDDNGMSQWMNNPFAYALLMSMFNGGGLGGNRGNQMQDAEIQSKLNQLSTQLQEGNNTNLLMDAIKGNTTALGQLEGNLNCDFNQLQSGICAVQAAIQQVGGKVGCSAERVINAINLGDLNIIQQFKDCCCQTQQNIIRMGYENQLGQKDIINGIQQGFAYTNTGIERGFSNIGFQLSSMACDLKTNANANTQRIIDTLNNHWQEDLQLRLNRAELELSQQRQNAALISALAPAKTTTA